MTNQIKNSLIEKFHNRNAAIGIIGLGYVGLPLAVAFANVGFKVLGVDVDEQKVSGLNAGISHVEDIENAAITHIIDQGLFRATTNYADLNIVDAISICVPTPLRKTKDPDLSYIISATNSIAQVGIEGKLIVLESTTYPGTTEELVLPSFANETNQVGKTFFLAFSPERIDPGRTDHNMWTTPKVIGGITQNCNDIVHALYSTVVNTPVIVSSPSTAEMVKLLENTFRAVNIGLVNEVALMCDRLGLNVWEVIDAAATKPYGFMKFTPGPGLGGHCIPIDPHYLSWKLKTLNYNARFIALADEINRSMPEYVVDKVTKALNADKKAIHGSKILIIGVAYKPNVGDLRESPALDIIHLLQNLGAELSYHDPYVSSISYDSISLEATKNPYTAVKDADCVIIVTNHAIYDWSKIQDTSACIVDTRNALKNETMTRVISI